MLRMKEVYANNPAMGDPNMLDKKVEENAQKLDAIRQELHKFEVSRLSGPRFKPELFILEWVTVHLCGYVLLFIEI